MHLLRHITWTYLSIRLHFHKITATGAFGPDSAVYLDSAPLKNSSKIKDNLLKFYTKQYHESSCSVASVVTVVNALGTLQQHNFTPISQMDILNKVRTGHWKERMGPKGHNGRRGLPLMLLRQVVEASLKAYRIKYNSVSAVHAVKNASKSLSIKQTLRKHLSAFESHDQGVLIAHFDQGAYVKSENIPHISPVGGFDLKSQKVMILDVDRYQKSPYQISFDRFYSGLASNYHHFFRPFGYGSGGYIWVEL